MFNVRVACQALVDKSHAEYWLQVSAQRLLKVDCAEARHVPDMDKLEGCIEKVGVTATNIVCLFIYFLSSPPLHLSRVLCRPPSI